MFCCEIIIIIIIMEWKKGFSMKLQYHPGCELEIVTFTNYFLFVLHFNC